MPCIRRSPWPRLYISLVPGRGVQLDHRGPTQASVGNRRDRRRLPVAAGATLVGHLPYTLAFQILIVAVLIVRISESTRMPRPLAHPLRPLTPAEQQALDQILRAPSQPLRRHQRAQALLAVAAGSTLAAAAGAVGWRVGDTVATR